MSVAKARAGGAWPIVALWYVDKGDAGGRVNYLRKAWHALGLVIPFALYMRLFGDSTRMVVTVGLVAFLALLVATDLLRFNHEGFRKLYIRLLGTLMKEGEHFHFNASVPYIIANLLLVLVCTPEAVIIGCLLLNLGDAAASIIGGQFGRFRFWNGRSVLGTFSFIVFGFACCVVFLMLHSTTPGDFFNIYRNGANLPLLASLFAGTVAAAIGELVSVTKWRGLVDDNLFVPPAGILGMWAVAGPLGEGGRLFSFFWTGGVGP